MSNKIRSTRIVDNSCSRLSSRKHSGKSHKSHRGHKVGAIMTPKPGHDKIEDHQTELSPVNDCKLEEDAAWKAYWSQEELLGRYQPIRELGRGSYGVVYEAVSLWEDAKLGIKKGTKVALKKIRRLWKTDTDAKRLLREVRILRKLHGHKCIVRLFDILPPRDANHFKDITLVFEFVDADLGKIFKTYQFFSSLHVEYMLYYLLLGLKWMHDARIAHRDLKPANVLINADCTIKICDFGLARHYMADLDEIYHDPLKKANDLSDDSDDEKSRRKGRKKPIQRHVTVHVQTRWYRSPEVIILNQKEKHLAAVDMWSVGCIFAELMQMNKCNCGNVASRGPLFPGDSCFPLSPRRVRPGHSVTQSNYDQILVIFNITGKPSQKDILELTDDEQAQKYLMESKPHDSYHSSKSQNRHQKRHAKHVNSKHHRQLTKRRQHKGKAGKVGNAGKAGKDSNCDKNGNDANDANDTNEFDSKEAGGGSGDEKEEELNGNGLTGGVDFEEMFPGSNSNAIDLLRKLLAFKPQDRISVAKAIEHPLFDRVRDIEAEKAVCDKNVDFDFETVRLERKELRSLILGEVVFYNPKEKERYINDSALFKVEC